MANNIIVAQYNQVVDLIIIREIRNNRMFYDHRDPNFRAKLIKRAVLENIAFRINQQFQRRQPLTGTV